MTRERGHVHIHLISVLVVVVLILVIGEYFYREIKAKPYIDKTRFSSEELDMTRFSRGSSLSGAEATTTDIPGGGLKQQIYSAVDRMNSINRAKADVFVLFIDSLPQQERERAVREFLRGVDTVHDSAVIFMRRINSRTWKNAKPEQKNREIAVLLNSIYTGKLSPASVGGTR